MRDAVWLFVPAARMKPSEGRKAFALRQLKRFRKLLVGRKATTWVSVSLLALSSKC